MINQLTAVQCILSVKAESVNRPASDGLTYRVADVCRHVPVLSTVQGNLSS